MAKFARGALVAVVISCVLLQASVAVAGPMAEWSGPWAVIPFIFDDGATRAMFAFGQGAQAGEIRNTGSSSEPLPGTSALARADAKVDAGGCVFTCNGFNANIELLFLRTFQLSGSPSGLWDVSLTGIWAGKIATLGNGRASVDASVVISSLNFPDIGLEKARVDLPPHNDVRNATLDLFEVSTDRKLLNDGTYLVFGSLEVKTFAAEDAGFPFFTSSSSAEADFSDFFGLNGGLIVGVGAAPVPEPGTIVLFGIGASALGRFAWRRQRRN